MTALNSGGYQIHRSEGVCEATGRALKPGEPFVAVLAERPDSEDLIRQDFSLDAWQSGARPKPPLSVFGSWRAVAAQPNEKRRLLVDDNSLMELFEQLAEQTRPRRIAFRFVLALILIRKRLLVLESSRGESILVRPKGTARPPEGPPLIEVIDPGLDDETIEGVTEQLQSVMAGDSGDREDDAPESAGDAGGTA